MTEERERQWASLVTVLSENGHGCIAVQVNGLERAYGYASRLEQTVKEAGRFVSQVQFDSSTTTPQQVVNQIKEATVNFNNDNGVILLVGIAQVLEPRRADFWKNMNFVRETIETFRSQIVWILSPDEYSLFLTEADHFADWCMLRIDLTTERDINEKMLLMDEIGVDPRQARAALENLEQLLLHDSEMGIDVKKMTERYYLPMLFLAVDAQDYRRAEVLRGKIQGDLVPDRLNRKWIKYDIDIDMALEMYDSVREKEKQFVSTILNAKKDKISIDDLHFAANIAQRSGDYNQAINFFERSLTIQLKMYGEKHPGVATIYNNLGMIYNDLGNHQKAIGLYEKALAIDIAVLGDQHPNVAIRYNNLGFSFANLGEYQKAVEYYEKALAIGIATLSDRHPRIAIQYNNLGSAYDDLGDHQKAIRCYEKALVTDTAVFGEQHPNVAICYNNLGSAYDDLGDHHKAIGYYEKALVIDKAVFGEQHPNIAIGYNNLGAAYGNLGDHQKAIRYYDEALVIDTAVFGEQHPNVAIQYNNLGTAYDDLGDHQKAIEYFQKSLAIFTAFFGQDHPSTRNVRGNLEGLQQRVAK